jgi:hypothetical protein
MKVVGRRGRQIWRVGQILQVLLARVDARRRTVGLVLAEPAANRRGRRKNKAARHGAQRIR